MLTFANLRLTSFQALSCIVVAVFSGKDVEESTLKMHQTTGNTPQKYWQRNIRLFRSVTTTFSTSQLKAKKKRYCYAWSKSYNHILILEKHIFRAFNSVPKVRM